MSPKSQLEPMLQGIYIADGASIMDAPDQNPGFGQRTLPFQTSSAQRLSGIPLHQLNLAPDHEYRKWAHTDCVRDAPGR
jgi:hypothetical protein